MAKTVMAVGRVNRLSHVVPVDSRQVQIENCSGD